MRKAISVEVIPESREQTAFNALIPGLPDLPSTSSPARTSMRLSPKSGTTSATVPMATKSRYSLRLGSLPSFQCPSLRRRCLNAMTRLKATPTPASSLKAKAQSERLGSSTARAPGRESGGSWWSVIMTSIPSSPARTTSSLSDMPQSTVIRSLQPPDARFLNPSALSP